LTFLNASLLARFARFWLLIGLAAAGTALSRAADPDPDVQGSMPEDYFPGLKAMIDQALKQAPSVVLNQMNIEVAQAEKLSNGIAPMLPHLGGFIYGGAQNQAAANNSGGSQRSTGFYYDVLFGQPVFQWGQLKNGLLTQKVQVAIAERNYATVYLTFAQTLRSRYLGLIAGKIALRNAQFVLELEKRANVAVQEQLKAGLVTAASAMGPEMQQEGAQIAAESSEQSYLFARRQLARLIGRPDISDAEIPSTVPAPRFSSGAAANLTSDLLRTGARYTPEAQLGLLNIRTWDLNYRINKVNLLPRVSLTAEVNQQNLAQVNGGVVSQNAVTTQSYYVRADWNIFDGLATRGRKQEALVRRRQAERDLKIKVDATEDAVQNGQKLVELAWRSLELSTRTDEINHATLQRAIEDYAVHTGSEAAVQSARANAYASEYTLALTRSNFLGQWSDFVALVGHDPAINNLPARYVRPVQ
jgi:outer membrane protein TolC